MDPLACTHLLIATTTSVTKRVQVQRHLNSGDEAVVPLFAKPLWRKRERRLDSGPTSLTANLARAAPVLNAQSSDTSMLLWPDGLVLLPP